MRLMRMTTGKLGVIIEAEEKLEGTHARPASPRCR